MNNPWVFKFQSYQWYAEPLCKEVDETKLPPFCVINHTILLINEAKIYPWCPSRCLEAI